MDPALQRTDKSAELFREFHIFGIIHGAVDDCRSFLIEGLLYYWKEIIFCSDPVSPGAKGLGKFYKIRIVESCEEFFVVPQLFFPFNKAVSSVVEYEADKIDDRA